MSKSAVSLALRRSPLLRAETGDRIRAVAEAMGWRPNPSVASWMAHRRAAAGAKVCGQQIIFVNVFPDLQFWRQRPSQTRFVAGVERRAKALGYEFEELWLAAPGMTTRRLDQILCARAVEGLVIGSAATSHAHLSLSWERFAAVAQGFSLLNPPLSRAANDYSHTTMSTLRELRRLGYARVGLLLQPEHDARSRAFWSSAYQRFQQHLEPHNRLQIFPGHDSDDVALAAWLKSERPDVVVTLNILFRTTLGRLGISIPADLGFACLDLHPGYEHLYSEITECAGFDHHVEFAGEAAVDLLAAQLNANERGVPQHPRTLLTQGKWVLGKTVRRVGPVVPLLGLPKRTSVVESEFAAEMNGLE